MQWNRGQKKVINSFLNGENLLIVGQAGTGKSAVIQEIHRLAKSDGKTIGITSTTGVSAYNIKGKTLHSFLCIGLGEDSAKELITDISSKPWARKIWKTLDVLVIDEISMLTPHLFDKLEHIARYIRLSEKDFGGIQLVMCGDFFQLPPVETSIKLEGSNMTAMCFDSDRFRACMGTCVLLTENMRQSNPEFQRILSEIRVGVVSAEGRKFLESRVGVDISVGNIKPTKMYPVKRSVNEINERELKKLVNPENRLKTFKARDIVITKKTYSEKQKKQWLARLEKQCKLPTKVSLAVGAQVMLTYNIDVEQGLFNGSRGVVTGFCEEDGSTPLVTFVNGIELMIVPQAAKLKINKTVKVERKQIPLKLAWATTIHKSQGLTLDLVELDAGSDNFENGQLYVGISRARTPEGLSLLSLDLDKISVHGGAHNFYMELMNTQ